MVDVTNAAERLIARKTNTPGFCLEWCDQALLQGLPSVGPGPHPIPTAYSAWLFATGKHAGDANVPKDFPVFLGPSPTRTDADKNAGDVMISLGNGLFACTDSPTLGAGHVGTCTLAQRMKQTQRPLLGWTSGFAGYALTTTTLASTGATPVQPLTTPRESEEDMYYKATTNSGGVIGAGWVYKQVGNGPLTPITNLEGVAVTASGVFIASYSGDDILLLTAVYGLAEYQVLPIPNTIWAGKQLDGPGKLSGRIIYPQTSVREYPVVTVAAA